MIKFIFDLDGTITSAETIPIIAKEFKVHQELIKLTMDTVAGKIPWKHSFIRRVELLKHVPVSDINSLLEKTPVFSELVNFIEKNSQDCCIATGNLDCWVDKLCKKIGCDYFSSSALVENNEIVSISHILEKADVVKSLRSNGQKIVFIGDSNNDVNAMRIADVSIAFGGSHPPSVRCAETADYTIDNEQDLVILLEEIKQNFSH